MRSTRLAELMGWGRKPQGRARLGAGYLRHLEKKGWVRCVLYHQGGDFYNFSGTITKSGEVALQGARG